MLDITKTKFAIESGNTYLGLELGSTRIKAVLIDDKHMPIASGSHTWENKLVGGIWTYSLDDIWSGLRMCYARLADEVRSLYGVMLTDIGAIGFSGMMHGYMAFDKDGELLVPFRTWRNTNTGSASAALSNLFCFNIPQRWSIAHLGQVLLDGEPHVTQLSYMTTLAGYIHWQLTGQKVIGVGDASGMFPIDSVTGQFNTQMMDQFDALARERNCPLRLKDILPRVLSAGDSAGVLTAEGAALLDPSGALKAGIPICPPEGDAGTGMTATNSVAQHTGNISAGTSVFAMIVLDQELTKVYPEIDLVTTPSGEPVAMVHCNNCTSDIDAWIHLLGEFAEVLGVQTDKDLLYALLYNKALEADDDCGELLAYNYYTGEPITGFSKGRPLFMRLPDSKLTLANFMRTHLFTALGALKIGLDILLEGEGVRVSNITGHGGFFKVDNVGQEILAAALGIPVSVMTTAGEGGPWGMAILAAYMNKKQTGETLEAYLKNKVFAYNTGVTANPNPDIAAGFEVFMQKYKKGLAVERAAVKLL